MKVGLAISITMVEGRSLGSLELCLISDTLFWETFWYLSVYRCSGFYRTEGRILGSKMLAKVLSRKQSISYSEAWQSQELMATRTSGLRP